jgi:enoyl-CoA hydratase/carnithine racemase
MSEPVLCERIEPHIVRITLNRPEAMNSVDPATTQAIDRLIEDTEADPETWVVIIRGAGDKAFCTGADLKAMSRGDHKRIGTRAGGFASFVFRPRIKPWIASVGGYALAGGLEIALACDIVIASENAVFGLPEVRRGVIASAGGLYRLPRSIPKAVAMDFILTGRPINAHQAFQYGLVSRLVSHERLDAEALEIAQTICANAPIAVRESRLIAKRAFDLSDDELRAESGAASKRNSLTEDYKEGPRAFVEKRSPRWIGR